MIPGYTACRAMQRIVEKDGFIKGVPYAEEHREHLGIDIRLLRNKKTCHDVIKQLRIELG